MPTHSAGAQQHYHNMGGVLSGGYPTPRNSGTYPTPRNTHYQQQQQAYPQYAQPAPFPQYAPPQCHNTDPYSPYMHMPPPPPYSESAPPPYWETETAYGAFKSENEGMGAVGGGAALRDDVLVAAVCCVPVCVCARA